MSIDREIQEAKQVYSTDSSIVDFFDSNTKATQKDCDDRATSLISAPVVPVSIQGCFSYTVFGGSPTRLVQFRVPESDIDVDLIHTARSIHGEIIASTTYHGCIGHLNPLSVYVIEKLPGITYMESCLRHSISTALSAEQFHRQKNTVADFSCFFAASWRAPQMINVRLTKDMFTKKLQVLLKRLPYRFSEVLSELSENLAFIFNEGYPTVLTHGDLCEMNFLVEPRTGHLTGVIDWAEAQVLPFGCALWGLENILGYMDQHGWHYFDEHQQLETLFWRTFENAIGESLEHKWKAIHLARMIGIVFRYGFCWDKSLQQRVVVESDSGMKYLDAFILGSRRRAGRYTVGLNDPDI